jgi:hypothetical protein
LNMVGPGATKVIVAQDVSVRSAMIQLLTMNIHSFSQSSKGLLWPSLRN